MKKWVNGILVLATACGLAGKEGQPGPVLLPEATAGPRSGAIVNHPPEMDTQATATPAPNFEATYQALMQDLFRQERKPFKPTNFIFPGTSKTFEGITFINQTPEATVGIDLPLLSNHQAYWPCPTQFNITNEPEILRPMYDANGGFIGFSISGKKDAFMQAAFFGGCGAHAAGETDYSKFDKNQWLAYGFIRDMQLKGASWENAALALTANELNAPLVDGVRVVDVSTYTSSYAPLAAAGVSGPFIGFDQGR